MTELINKLEEAGEGSRVLDKAVWGALCGTQRQPKPGLFTTSLDAALALASRVLPGGSPGVSRNVFHGYWSAWLHRNVDGACHLVGDACTASTPALALCAAILRASEQERGG